MRALLAAVQFMTILPVPIRVAGRDLERAPLWFPAVGALVGLIVASADWCGAALGLPPAILNVGTIALLAALTGGLHLDGLADTADGFLSARPKDRALEIMRDSRIGTMGVLALILVLALKGTALATLHEPIRWRALVLAPLLGRSMLLAAMSLLPYARAGGGLASVFLARRSRLLPLWALAWPAACAMALLGLREGLPLLAAGVVGTALLAAYSMRRIGGFTGDTLGATSELAEMLALIAIACQCPGGNG
ncbi:MAG: adenosylcobinamide-GDP ribazoletransferase [Candidatus Hydrogenedentes bacterium]|nr:adenosylcobinamide-GDP ribazoletransferase [Candidatus Hydrogenedentota bacterium]